MATSISSSIRKQVDRLFRQLHARRNDLCRNPVTGLQFVWGLDSISEQKREACRALVAREWHAQAYPDAPPLPLDAMEIDKMKSGGDEQHLFAYFAQSIHCRSYYVSGHPSFDTYARGVLSAAECPSFFKQNKDLVEKFPPQPIYGLEPGLVYLNPTKLARIAASP